MSATFQSVKHDFALPSGHWQLFSYGRLTELPTAKQAIWIKAYFRLVTVNENGDISGWLDEVVSSNAPIGILVAWMVGCVFNSEKRLVGQV